MLLGIPLLPLLAMLQLGEEGLPVRFVQLNDPFQFFHEEQLQHPLVRVQVCQLEELPLQNVIVSVPIEKTITYMPLRANTAHFMHFLKNRPHSCTATDQISSKLY